MTASPLIPRRERIVTWGNSVRVADSAVAPVGDDFTAAGVVHDLTGPRAERASVVTAVELLELGEGGVGPKGDVE